MEMSFSEYGGGRAAALGSLSCLKADNLPDGRFPLAHAIAAAARCPVGQNLRLHDLRDLGEVLR